MRKIEKTDVYLPEGSNWFDFWTGAKLAGGQTIQREVPIDIMPVYIRAGSIIPWGPAVQYATEKSWDDLEIRVYPGANATFILYEDENDNYNYEREFILLSLSVGMIVTVLCTSATVKEDIPECWKRGSSK